MLKRVQPQPLNCVMSWNASSYQMPMYLSTLNGGRAGLFISSYFGHRRVPFGVSKGYHHGVPALGSIGLSTTGTPMLRGKGASAATVRVRIMESAKALSSVRFTIGVEPCAVSIKSPLTVKHDAATMEPLTADDIPKNMPDN